MTLRCAAQHFDGEGWLEPTRRAEASPFSVPPSPRNGHLKEAASSGAAGGSRHVRATFQPGRAGRGSIAVSSDAGVSRGGLAFRGGTALYFWTASHVQLYVYAFIILCMCTGLFLQYTCPYLYVPFYTAQVHAIAACVCIHVCSM